MQLFTYGWNLETSSTETGSDVATCYVSSVEQIDEAEAEPPVQPYPNPFQIGMFASFAEVNSKIGCSQKKKQQDRLFIFIFKLHLAPAVAAEEDVELQHSVAADLVGKICCDPLT
jgi:hypothetical protein